MQYLIKLWKMFEIDVKLLTKWDGRYGVEAMITKLNFHSSIFAENLIAVELRKLDEDSTIYVGMCILEVVILWEF